MTIRGQQQEVELVEDERYVNGVAANTLDARHELNGRLELGGQEQHLEVEEGLLVGIEVTLS